MKKWLDVYDELARQFDDSISKSGYIADGKAVPEQIFLSWISHINSLVHIEEQDRVLDAGCGSGIFLKGFSQHSKNIFGCDGSAEQVSSALQSMPSAQLVVGDITERVFPDVNFDFIFCNSVFLLLNGFQAATHALDNLREMASSGAKIWIGDIPDVSPGLDGNFQRIGNSVNLPIQHYPDSFFFEYCIKHSINGQRLDQTYKTPNYRNNRYDFLIGIP